MAPTARNHPPRVQACGEVVADPLERRVVTARCDECGDPRVAERLERNPGLARQAPSLRTANAAHHLLRERLSGGAIAAISGRTGLPVKLARLSAPGNAHRTRSATAASTLLARPRP